MLKGDSWLCLKSFFTGEKKKKEKKKRKKKEKKTFPD